MKKEMSRLESVAKDTQCKHTLVEQRLEQKMQEGMTVFKRLMSKLPPDAFASETSAMTSRLNHPGMLQKKVQLLQLNSRKD